MLAESGFTLSGFEILRIFALARDLISGKGILPFGRMAAVQYFFLTCGQCREEPWDDREEKEYSCAKMNSICVWVANLGIIVIDFILFSFLFSFFHLSVNSYLFASYGDGRLLLVLAWALRDPCSTCCITEIVFLIKSPELLISARVQHGRNYGK